MKTRYWRQTAALPPWVASAQAGGIHRGITCYNAGKMALLVIVVRAFPGFCQKTYLIIRTTSADVRRLALWLGMIFMS